MIKIHLFFPYFFLFHTHRKDEKNMIRRALLLTPWEEEFFSPRAKAQNFKSYVAHGNTMNDTYILNSLLWAETSMHAIWRFGNKTANKNKGSVPRKCDNGHIWAYEFVSFFSVIHTCMTSSGLRKIMTTCSICHCKLSVESLKGTINIQRCSTENQKGTIAVQSLYGTYRQVVNFNCGIWKSPKWWKFCYSYFWMKSRIRVWHS